jgi:hypothetical protein
VSAAGLEVIRETYGALRWDATAVLARLRPGVALRRTDYLLWGARYRGPDGVGRFFAAAGRDSTVTAGRFIDAGDAGAVVGWTRTRPRAGVAFDVAILHV